VISDWAGQAFRPHRFLSLQHVEQQPVRDAPYELRQMERHLIDPYKNQHASSGIQFTHSTPISVEQLATKLDDGEGVTV
jgi:hypothetical protein